MPLVFLDFVNEVLIRSGNIQGDQGRLTTTTVTSTATGGVVDAFEDSARQRTIDTTLQVIQEVVHEVYNYELFPNIAGSATLTLVDGQREYDLPDNFIRFAGNTVPERVIRAATNHWTLSEYPGGYARMLADQPVATDWAGQPSGYAISPTANKLRLDTEPTSAENGHTYHYLYEKAFTVTATATEATGYYSASATMPFSDQVLRTLVPTAAELVNRAMKKDFDPTQIVASVARAMAILGRNKAPRRYGRRRLWM